MYVLSKLLMCVCRAMSSWAAAASWGEPQQAAEERATADGLQAQSGGWNQLQAGVPQPAVAGPAAAHRTKPTPGTQG